MAMTDQIRKNMFVMYNNEPYYITDAEFYSPGKGSAFTRVKMKNLNTSRLVPFTFKSGEKLEELDVSFNTMQYLYVDDANIIFMDANTYEQFEFKKSIGEQYLPFMKEGHDYVVGLYQDRIITIKFPAQVVLEITETAPAVRGNTATNALKEAIVETGHKVMVPLFLEAGEKIKVDPETSAYQGRVNE